MYEIHFLISLRGKKIPFLMLKNHQNFWRILLKWINAIFTYFVTQWSQQVLWKIPSTNFRKWWWVQKNTVPQQNNNSVHCRIRLTICGTIKLQFFYAEILPELKNRLMPKTVNAICKETTKIKTNHSGFLA